jgi:hypothetical protein
MVDKYIIHHDAYLYLHITISIKQDIIIFMVIMQCICENMLIYTTYKDTNLAGKLDLNRPETQIKQSRCICSPHPIPWTRCQEKRPPRTMLINHTILFAPPLSLPPHHEVTIPRAGRL